MYWHSYSLSGGPQSGHVGFLWRNNIHNGSVIVTHNLDHTGGLYNLKEKENKNHSLSWILTSCD